MRLFAVLVFCISALFSHGLFYEVQQGNAVILHLNFSESVPARFAKVTMYKGDSAIPFIESVADDVGVFAFVPREHGMYRVHVSGTSDHGEHTQEFELNIDDKFKLQSYEQPLFERYSGVLGVIGIILGFFGLLMMFKSRKQS